MPPRRRTIGTRRSPPETSPQQWTLEAFPVFQAVESDEIDHVQRLLFAARNELVNSQSARLPSGLMPFDLTRFSAIVDKLEKFVVDYVEKASPLDLPESSPSKPVSGAGATGI